jgi:uncharacterized protein YggE
MSHSNRFTLIVIITLAVALVATNLANASAAPANPPSGSIGVAATCDTGRSINVSGSAVINVVPDQVTLQIGVTSNDPTPGGVHAKNTIAINRVIAALRGLGIADKDMSTDYYVIQPLYNNYDSQVITGYRINNIVAVKLKEVSKVSDVLAAALEAGANEVIDVQFETTQLRKVRDDARAAAMKAAQEKAQALASTAGAQAGCVLSIDENSSSNYGGYSWWGGRYQLQTQNVMQNAPSGNQSSSEEGPISLGQIAVRAEVQARFSLK